MKKWMLIAVAVAFVACGDSSKNAESNAKIAESSVDSAKSAKNAESSSNVANVAKVDSADSAKDSANATKIAESSVDSAKDSANVAQKAPQKSAVDLYKKCIACHGARGDKVAPGSAGSILIADLSKQILIDDMKGYRAKTLSRGGTSAIMYLQANGLSDDDIEILAEYISNFKK
ncbi:c-type cytochrome [Helicobacter sp. 23-1044]